MYHFRKFLECLLTLANNRGFHIDKPKRYDHFKDTDVAFLREKLVLYRENKCTFIMFFTRDKKDSVHDRLKFLEVCQAVDVTLGRHILPITARVRLRHPACLSGDGREGAWQSRSPTRTG